MRALVAMAIWLLASAASAQVSLVVTAPPGTSGTEYTRYVDRVLAESPLWADAEAMVRAADAQIDVARVLPSMRLYAGVSSVDISGANAPNSTQIVLSLPLDYAGQTGRRVDARVVEHQATVAIADTTRRDLRRLAAERFVEALRASLVRIRATEAAQADAALLAAIEGRASAGEATSLQVGLARLAAASGVARRTEAEGAERTTRLALSQLLAQVDTTLAPVGDLGVAPRTFDADALVEEALTRRPEILAAQLLEATAGRERELASAARWPELDVQVGWIHSFASLAPSLFNQPEYDALILGASIEIPLRLAWDGDLRAADAAIDRSEAALRSAELSVSVEVREALAQYETARDRLAAQEGALVQATALRAAAQQALSQGAGTVVELLAAQAAAREAEAAYLDAAAEHARTLVILLARVGRNDDVL